MFCYISLHIHVLWLLPSGSEATNRDAWSASVCIFMSVTVWAVGGSPRGAQHSTYRKLTLATACTSAGATSSFFSSIGYTNSSANDDVYPDNGRKIQTIHPTNDNNANIITL